MLYISGFFGSLIATLAQKSKKLNLCKPMPPFDRKSLLLKYPHSVQFSQKETNHGISFLRNIGIGLDQPFVCLNVRDSAYLAQTASESWSNSRDWSYHNYRNSNIETYLKTAETLAEAGYAVFRMGAIVENKLKTLHPRVFDYATNGMRTEFLDIFLGSKCAFTITTGSGWCSIPDLFRKPVLTVNKLPIYAGTLALNHIIYPKILLDQSTHEELTLKEIISRRIVDGVATKTYLDANAQIKDLSSDELAEVATEMVARVEGTFVETDQQKQMQDRLNQILSTHPNLQPTPHYNPVIANFASCFLSRYPNFLDGLA